MVGRKRRHRNKEADSITLKHFPPVKDFRAWRSALRYAVASASGRGDDAMRWVREVESDGATHASLRKPGSRYESLDQS